MKLLISCTLTLICFLRVFSQFSDDNLIGIVLNDIDYIKANKVKSITICTTWDSLDVQECEFILNYNKFGNLISEKNLPFDNKSSGLFYIYIDSIIDKTILIENWHQNKAADTLRITQYNYNSDGTIANVTTKNKISLDQNKVDYYYEKGYLFKREYINKYENVFSIDSLHYNPNGTMKYHTQVFINENQISIKKSYFYDSFGRIQNILTYSYFKGKERLIKISSFNYKNNQINSIKTSVIDSSIEKDKQAIFAFNYFEFVYNHNMLLTKIFRFFDDKLGNVDTFVYEFY